MLIFFNNLNVKSLYKFLYKNIYVQSSNIYALSVFRSNFNVKLSFTLYFHSQNKYALQFYSWTFKIKSLMSNFRSIFIVHDVHSRLNVVCWKFSSSKLKNPKLKDWPIKLILRLFLTITISYSAHHLRQSSLP